MEDEKTTTTKVEKAELDVTPGEENRSTSKEETVEVEKREAPQDGD